MEQRTYTYSVKLQDGTYAVPPCQKPATVEVAQVWNGLVIRTVEVGRHVKDFARVCKAHGGKYLPGTREWKFDDPTAAIAALRADGFTVLDDREDDE